jgi:hypothetical protein
VQFVALPLTRSTSSLVNSRAPVRPSTLSFMGFSLLIKLTEWAASGRSALAGIAVFKACGWIKGALGGGMDSTGNLVHFLLG